MCKHIYGYRPTSMLSSACALFDALLCLYCLPFAAPVTLSFYQELVDICAHRDKAPFMLFVETLSEKGLDSAASARLDSSFTSPSAPRPPADNDRLGSNAAAGPGALHSWLHCSALPTGVLVIGISRYFWAASSHLQRLHGNSGMHCMP